MWATQIQTDLWLNLGDGKVAPDEWVRVSAIERIRMVEGARYAVAILKSGVQIVTAYTAQQLMQRIADSAKDQQP